MAKYNGKVKLSVNFKPIVWLLENLNELIERINNINIDTGDIEDLENTLKTLYAYIKNVEEASKQSDKVLSDLINSNTTFLQNQINNIKTSISELETLVNTNKTDIESINEKINNINQSLTNINNSISEINRKINTINTNIANNTTDISELERRVTTNESDISTNRTNIISNSNRITALENFPFTKNLKLIGGEGGWEFNFTQNFDVTIELNDPSLGDLTGAYLIAYEFIDLGQNITYSPEYLSKYGYFYYQLGYDSESEIIRNNIHFHWEKTSETVPFKDSDNIYFMGIITRLNNVVQ